MPILAFFIPALLGGIATVLGSLVGRVLVALGISYVTYKGVDVAINYVADYVRSALSSGPVTIVSFLSFMWVDKAVSITFASFTAALAIKGAAGAITKQVFKK